MGKKTKTEFSKGKKRIYSLEEIQHAWIETAKRHDQKKELLLKHKWERSALLCQNKQELDSLLYRQRQAKKRRRLVDQKLIAERLEQTKMQHANSVTKQVQEHAQELNTLMNKHKKK